MSLTKNDRTAVLITARPMSLLRRVLQQQPHPLHNEAATGRKTGAGQWQKGGRPPAFQRGIKCLPPGKKHWFRYRTFNEILADNSACKCSFVIAVEYRHP